MSVRQTYGDVWDSYVSRSFPHLQKTRGGDLVHPGDEWGNPESWERIFEKLFVASDVASWKYAVEIGGGGGKYTERVLRQNDTVKLWGFDVSQNFLNSTAERLAPAVKSNRLLLNLIDPLHPDGMLNKLEGAGVAGKVDALFSIDAMVHVDLQFLATYWANAAQFLRPGGRILMTLADPTSPEGFVKIKRDIKKFYGFQGRMCPKFEYLDQGIVRAVLAQLGFDVVMLEHWTYASEERIRDLYLIAELARPEQAAAWRPKLRRDTSLERPTNHDRAETIAEMWDREFDALSQGSAFAPHFDAAAALRDAAGRVAMSDWETVLEFSGGDTRVTSTLLTLSPRARLISHAICSKALDAQQNAHRDSDRVHCRQLDTSVADGILSACVAEGLDRKVDAVVALNLLHHIDLQYWYPLVMNAALVLKPDGVLLMSVADGASEVGARRILNDIQTFFAAQGRACPMTEYQSPDMIRFLLEAMGFEIGALRPVTPESGALGHELWIEARLSQPEKAEDFKGAISVTTPVAPAKKRKADAIANLSPERRMVVQAMGRSLFAREFNRANPGLSADARREAMNADWQKSRHAYLQFGRDLVEAMEARGFLIEKAGETVS